MFALGKVYTRKIKENQRLRTTANLSFILLVRYFSSQMFCIFSIHQILIVQTIKGSVFARLCMTGCASGLGQALLLRFRHRCPLLPDRECSRPGSGHRNGPAMPNDMINGFYRRRSIEVTGASSFAAIAQHIGLREGLWRYM